MIWKVRLVNSITHDRSMLSHAVREYDGCLQPGMHVCTAHMLMLGLNWNLKQAR